MASGKDQFKRTFDKVRDAIVDLQLDNLKDIGLYIANRIVQKARTGKTMYGGQEKKLKSLSERYIEQRKKWSKTHGDAVKKIRKSYPQDSFNYGGIGFEKAKQNTKDLDPDFFSPRRSNLTVTGEFLRSIELTEVDNKNVTVKIEPTGKREDGLENKKLGKYLSEGGRNIFGLDETGRKVVVNMVKDSIRRAMRKNLLQK